MYVRLGIIYLGWVVFVNFGLVAMLRVAQVIGMLSIIAVILIQNSLLNQFLGAFVISVLKIANLSRYILNFR